MLRLTCAELSAAVLCSDAQSPDWQRVKSSIRRMFGAPPSEDPLAEQAGRAPVGKVPSRDGAAAAGGQPPEAASGASHTEQGQEPRRR